MARDQRRHRLVVGHPSPVPGCGLHAILVGDMDPRLVANLPAGVVQAPDEIDVLAERELLVEPGAERLAPSDHRGARHVPHPRVRADQRGTRAHVEWRVAPLVRGDPARMPARRDDPRRDQRHRGILQVVEQVAGEAFGRDAIGVEERDDRGLGQAEAGVASRRGAAILAMAHVPGPEPVGERRDRGAVRRAVVDDDRRHASGQGRQAALELASVPVHGHDDRRLAARPLRPWWRIGLDEAGVEQPARQRPLGTILKSWLASQPTTNGACAPLRKHHQPRRGAAE